MARKTPDQRLLADLGARLAILRHARGMTQADVAESADLDPQSYQRAERGRISLSMARLRKIAKALGVPMAEVFASVGADVPEVPWEGDEAAAAAAWRRVPEDRRDLALRLLREFAR